MKGRIILLILFVFSSCAQRIKVPINRFLSPEAIGGGIGVEYRNMGFSSGVLDFSNNSTKNPLIMGTAKDEEFYLGLGIAPNADLFVRVPEESSTLIGIKVQLLGAPAKKAAAGHSLSFSLGMGNAQDKFDQTFKINLKSEVTDFSFIHGYRANPTFLIYDGISLSTYSFEGMIEGTTALDSDTIDYRAKNIVGGHIGAIFGTHILNLKLEYGVQKIQWSNTDEKLLQFFGTALSVGW